MFMNEAVVNDLLKDPNLNGSNTTAIDKAKTILAPASLGRKQFLSELRPQGVTADIYRRLIG